MTDFNYTVHAGLDSWVEDAWYNENTSELYVNLEDSIYVYQGVPRSVFDRLVAVDEDGGSVGGFYNDHIKRGGYGEAEYLDESYYVNAHYVAPAPSPGVATPKGLTDNTKAQTFSLPKPPVVANPNKERYGDGQPLFVKTEDAAPYFGMRASAPTSPRYDVTFEVNGRETKHLVTAESVVEAVNQLVNLFDAVGVTENIVVTGVNLRRG